VESVAARDYRVGNGEEDDLDKLDADDLIVSAIEDTKGRTRLTSFSFAL
jgi:hypothetical protein